VDVRRQHRHRQRHSRLVDLSGPSADSERTCRSADPGGSAPARRVTPIGWRTPSLGTMAAAPAAPGAAP